jgi:hypothetical protein
LWGDYKDQNWENWLLFMLKGIEQTAIWTCDKITAIKALSESTTDYIKAQLPKIYSYELVQLIFEQPYCRISNLVERDIAKRQTASTYLKQLADIGVLQEINSGKEKLFVHPRLMTLMTKDKRQKTKDNNSIKFSSLHKVGQMARGIDPKHRITIRDSKTSRSSSLREVTASDDCTQPTLAITTCHVPVAVCGHCP